MAMSPTVTARCNTVNGGGGGGSVRASEYTSGDTNPPLRVYQVLSSSVHGNWIESCGACCGRTPWRARNSAGNTFEPHAAVWVPQATLSEMSTRQNTRRLALAPIARKDERPKAKKSCLRRLYSFRRHVCCRNPMAAALLAWWWRLGKTLLCARLARCISSSNRAPRENLQVPRTAKTPLAPSLFSTSAILKKHIIVLLYSAKRNGLTATSGGPNGPQYVQWPLSTLRSACCHC